MEEILAVAPKLLEMGFLGTINVILIWKGIPAMNKLSESNTQLATAIGKLTDNINNRLEIVVHDLKDIKTTLDVVLRRLDLIEKNNHH